MRPGRSKLYRTWQGVPVPMTRRSVLAGLGSVGSLGAIGAIGGIGALTAGLTGCGSSEQSDGSVVTTTDAGEAIRQEVIAAETALVALYVQAIAALPDLEPALSVIRDQHTAHAVAMGAQPDAQGAAPTSVPATAAQVLQGLIDAERAAVGARTAACVGAPEAELARVLTLITASESSHVPYLTSIAGG